MRLEPLLLLFAAALATPPPSEVYGVRGEPLSLACGAPAAAASASAPAPAPGRGRNNNRTWKGVTFAWYRDGDALAPLEPADSRVRVLRNGTLHLQRFEPELDDGARYRCEVRGPRGAALSPSVTLRLARLSPDFSRSPSDLVVLEGDSFRLACSPDSAPEARVGWERDGRPLPAPLPERYALLPGGGLLVRDAAPGDSGSYRCSASNPELRETAYSAPGNVSVVAAPPGPRPFAFLDGADDSAGPVPVAAPHGGETALDCVVNGRPRPKVTWTFRPEGRPELTEFSSMDLLPLSRLSEDDDGVYECTAFTRERTARRSFRLRVLRPPHFRLSPASERVPAARTVRFNCSAGGSPPPEVSWYKDGRRLAIAGRLRVQSGEGKPPGLIVSDTVTSDAGVYQCFASNALGEAQAWGALSFRPSNVTVPPSGVECVPLDARTVRVSWEPADYETVAYTVHSASADGTEHASHISNQSVVFRMENLRPYESYGFFVRSYVGRPGSASDPSRVVVCQGQGVPVSLRPTADRGLTVSWRGALETAPRVTGWLLQWRPTRSDAPPRNVTLDRDVSEYAVPGVGASDGYEFRLLASTPDGRPDQDLKEIPWTSTRRAVPYDGAGPDTEAEDAAPTDVRARPAGPRAVDVTWRGETADGDSAGRSFVVCYSPSGDVRNPYRENLKIAETCTESVDDRIAIGGLDPDTEYRFRVRSVTENRKRGGPFSEAVACRTEREGRSPIADVRWEFVSEGVINVSWIHYGTESRRPDDDTARPSGEIVYAVRYTQNPSDAFGKWKFINVTDVTSAQLRDVDTNVSCYLIVSLLGEEERNVVIIPPMDGAASASDRVDSENRPYWVLLCVAAVAVAVGAAVVCFAFFDCPHARRRKSDSSDDSSARIRPARTDQSDYERDRLVHPDARLEGKRSVVYMNGLSSDAKERSVGEPLLNGHVRITENPHFVSGAAPSDTLDLSRSEDFRNRTTEPAPGDDGPLAGPSPASARKSISGNGNREVPLSTLQEEIILQVDRNSNSELSNVGAIRETISIAKKNIKESKRNSELPPNPVDSNFHVLYSKVDRVNEIPSSVVCDKMQWLAPPLGPNG